MKDSEQIKDLYSRDLETRKNWYGAAAIAYDRTRPRYPKQLIDRIVEITQLSPKSPILEGCDQNLM